MPDNIEVEALSASQKEKEAPKHLIVWIPDDIAENELPASMPEYIADQFSSRMGRGGRGRLWVAMDMSLPGGITVDWPRSDLGRSLLNCGGIVINASDLPSFDFDDKWFDMTVTTMDMVVVGN